MTNGLLLFFFQLIYFLFLSSQLHSPDWPSHNTTKCDYHLVKENSANKSNWTLHTHTHIYIYMYVCVYIYIYIYISSIFTLRLVFIGKLCVICKMQKELPIYLRLASNCSYIKKKIPDLQSSKLIRN